ncbi:LRR receptor-like serine/threonine-protein kinase RPK2 [Tripterygium wilfordii]|uniref:non-specific serine/threonine protein kinase n=1 Tax=Tripterygium wilfordii TaxID=458696 RepID=A0A7J7DQW0_TRIWF|nr:LRR receptor-like serine/threonine-protein kinase RPK2 [Tripterygium wilfordii]KAF5748659.1 LRR receptor-like serine/threonine-protein kinase RPK2 [Tripterygium wilfordii]
MWLLWFLVFSALVSSQPINSNDSAWLLTFKDSVSHDPNNLLSGWNPTTHFCTWYGVTCDPTSTRVVALNITGNVDSLAGTISSSIGNLTELRVLSLPHHAFSGEIPSTVEELKSLEVLELQGNNLSGKIPDEIIRIPSLRVLNLSFNSLSGTIPRTLIGNGKLGVVDLSNNLLSGEVSIDGFAKCESLSHLKLSRNYLMKTIPPEIGNCTNLRTLLLDGNILEGQIAGEIGRIVDLRILDISRNSLTGEIPKELGNCMKLSILVLTRLDDFGSDGLLNGTSRREEFNAFDGSLPDELLMLPNLQILWASRGGNIGGRLPDSWSSLCSLRVLNLGQNYIDGVIPESLVMCKNLTFLDLSSNKLVGNLPQQIRVPCMVHFNISRNNISGVLPSFGEGGCITELISYEDDPSFLSKEDIQIAYGNIPIWSFQVNTHFGSLMANSSVIIHDFSWNKFVGFLPLFSVGNEFLATQTKPSYRLLLNNNEFSGNLPGALVSNCNDLLSFSVNLNGNHISGGIHEAVLADCQKIAEFEAADNLIDGSLALDVGQLMMLQLLDLGGNRLTGSLSEELGRLRNLKWIFLGRNNLEGEIPSQLGQLTSLVVLDLSHNALEGSIPSQLTDATKLEIILLDHNRLSGKIPSSFSFLSSVTIFNVSYNNLSGYIPHLRSQTDCSSFVGNMYLACSSEQLTDQPSMPSPAPSNGTPHAKRKVKPLIVTVVSLTSIVLCILLAIILVYVCRSRKLGSRLSSIKEKVVVTFADAPSGLSYENVVKATGNFSIRNLIGRGGFGSTYKAELMPGYLVAVKRLSIGRIQGIQQFDAEIRTLGRVRHKNLVTLIGYYVGDGEMFLVYNYLSGGNLETFIHNRSGIDVQWSEIYKIATDIAQALAYLHYLCVPRILHRDIKPSNILLDEELNAYLSDFGLARLLEVSQTHATTDVAGTFGYVAPEYATTCRVSDKADVYSFGVVMLELMSGKKSLDPSFSEYGNGFNVVAWARLLIKEGRSSELFSAHLWESGPEEKLLGMLKLALTCTLETLPIRPSMKLVLDKLKQLES